MAAGSASRSRPKTETPAPAAFETTRLHPGAPVPESKTRSARATEEPPSAVRANQGDAGIRPSGTRPVRNRRPDADPERREKVNVSPDASGQAASVALAASSPTTRRPASGAPSASSRHAQTGLPVARSHHATTSEASGPGPPVICGRKTSAPSPVQGVNG